MQIHINCLCLACTWAQVSIIAACNIQLCNALLNYIIMGCKCGDYSITLVELGEMHHVMCLLSLPPIKHLTSSDGISCQTIHSSSV